MTEETKQVVLQLTAEEIVGVIHAAGVTGYMLAQYADEVGSSDDPLAKLYMEKADRQREALVRFLAKLQASIMEADGSTLQ